MKQIPSSTLLTLALGASALCLIPNAKAGLVFDNISNYENSVAGASATTTGSTPNTFMGDAYTLAAGTTSITGFDLYPVNLSGTTYTGLKINIFVWGTVNTGAVSAAAPAFSNPLGSYTLTETGTFSSGFFFPIEGATPGSSPGLTLPSPLALAGTTIGLTFNIQGTTDGVTYNNVNSLTSLISYGTLLPTVGSQVFNGYYRNANSEVDGNFTSGLRSLGQQNQSLAVRIYGDGIVVPEPGTMALAALGGLALLAFRRRQ